MTAERLKPGTPHMVCWVITERPRDWPDWFVAREHHYVKGEAGFFPTENMKMARTLEDVRRMLPPNFVVCIPRMEGDDPAVVECWF